MRDGVELTYRPGPRRDTPLAFLNGRSVPAPTFAHRSADRRRCCEARLLPLLQRNPRLDPRCPPRRNDARHDRRGAKHSDRASERRPVERRDAVE